MTTDWTKQTEEMVRTWTNVQQRMMENTMNMIGMGAMGSSAGDVWNKSVDAWHESMKTALEAQVNWTQFMADTVKANAGSTPQVNEMAQQAVEMTKTWSEGQMQVLGAWFDAVKASEPTTMMRNMNPEEMMKLMQTWQGAAQKMMETQMDMIKSMTEAVAKKEG